MRPRPPSIRCRGARSFAGGCRGGAGVEDLPGKFCQCPRTNHHGGGAHRRGRRLRRPANRRRAFATHEPHCFGRLAAALARASRAGRGIHRLPLAQSAAGNFRPTHQPPRRLQCGQGARHRAGATLDVNVPKRNCATELRSPRSHTPAVRLRRRRTDFRRRPAIVRLPGGHIQAHLC